MRFAHKLRVVPDCPMPESPIKPVVMGCPLKPVGTPIKANPNAGDLHAIMFAQSLMTRNGVVARAPDATTAARIIARSKKPRIRVPVTVPTPLSPCESPRTAPTGQGGAFPSRHAADDGESRSHCSMYGAPAS